MTLHDLMESDKVMDRAGLFKEVVAFELKSENEKSAMK